MTDLSQQEDPLDIEGPAAPPRQNGELVFTAPWQSRMFATTMRLHESGRISWDRFRDDLIAQIATHEQALIERAGPNPADDRDAWEGWDYWGCWQRALEGLLDELSVISSDELDASADVLAARPPGHDHDHGDHSHDHGDHGHQH